jgi:two-component system response regulator PilR (NtrC family)
MPQARALIATDHAPTLEAFSPRLQALAVEPQVACTTAAARALLGRERFQLVVCDLAMEGGRGQELLRTLGECAPATAVVCVTNGTPTPPAGPAGARRYWCGRPLDAVAIAMALHGALAADPGPGGPATGGGPFLIGTSAPMRALAGQIAKVARADSNVCITGESGAGKELVARAIHWASRRRDRPLIVCDCTTLPEGLMESELFGHVKGAFTSAGTDRDGLFHLADGGTFFLDEIGELGLPLQAKLLRVIQSREFRKLGGKQTITVDVRIIAATNQDLGALVRRGRFREDLLYRLNVIPLAVPPLRDHKDDIPLLVHHFLAQVTRQTAKPIHRVSPEALALLFQYDWPGNVRELANCIERAAVLTDGTTIGPADVAFLLGPTGRAPAGTGARPAKDGRKASDTALLLRTLASVNGNRRRAAEVLGMSVRTLHYKIRALREEWAGQPPPAEG